MICSSNYRKFIGPPQRTKREIVSSLPTLNTVPVPDLLNDLRQGHNGPNKASLYIQLNFC